MAPDRVNGWISWGFADLDAVGTMAHEPQFISIEELEAMSPNERFAVFSVRLLAIEFCQKYLLYF